MAIEWVCDTSSKARKRGGRISFWIERMETADAKKVEGASFIVFLILSPPFLTGKEASGHWSSFMPTFKMLVRPSLRHLSNSSRRVLPLHSEVCSVQSSFVMLMEFLRSVRASHECRRARRLIALSRCLIFWLSTLSTAAASRKGAPRRDRSFQYTRLKWSKTLKDKTVLILFAIIFSHLFRLR